MNDMEVGDTVEEEVALPTQEVPVHSGCGAARERPGVIAVVGKHRVGVMEVRDHNKPMCYTQPWDSVVLDDSGESPGFAGETDGIDHCGDSDVREDHCVALTLREQYRIG